MRSRSMGSVSTRVPSSSTSAVAWPTYVMPSELMRAISQVVAAHGGHGDDVGHAARLERGRDGGAELGVPAGRRWASRDRAGGRRRGRGQEPARGASSRPRPGPRARWCSPATASSSATASCRTRRSPARCGAWRRASSRPSSTRCSDRPAASWRGSCPASARPTRPPARGLARSRRRGCSSCCWACSAAPARGAPVLLVVEDLHWADGSTRDLLRFLVRAAAAERLALVATYRTDDLHRGHPLRPYVAELARDPRVEPHRRCGRSRATSFADHVASILGSAAERRASSTASSSARRATPFFTEELLAAAGRGRSLPASLRDAMLARLERLSAADPARAAGARRRRTARRLRAARRGVAAARGRSWPRRCARRSPRRCSSPRDGAYEFRHALLREAAYARAAARRARAPARRAGRRARGPPEPRRRGAARGARPPLACGRRARPGAARRRCAPARRPRASTPIPRRCATSSGRSSCGSARARAPARASTAVRDHGRRGAGRAARPASTSSRSPSPSAAIELTSTRAPSRCGRRVLHARLARLPAWTPDAATRRASASAAAVALLPREPHAGARARARGARAAACCSAAAHRRGARADRGGDRDRPRARAAPTSRPTALATRIIACHGRPRRGGGRRRGGAARGARGAASPRRWCARTSTRRRRSSRPGASRRGDRPRARGHRGGARGVGAERVLGAHLKGDIARRLVKLGRFDEAADADRGRRCAPRRPGTVGGRRCTRRAAADRRAPRRRRRRRGRGAARARDRRRARRRHVERPRRGRAAPS